MGVFATLEALGVLTSLFRPVPYGQRPNEAGRGQSASLRGIGTAEDANRREDIRVGFLPANRFYGR